MQNGLTLSAEAHFSSKDRLVDAVLRLWEEVGSGSMSVRMLAQAADVRASSIYHHFGSLEQLFAVAQDHAYACAAHWRDGHMRDLAEAGLDASAFGPLFAAVIDSWTHDQRRLAFAWREGQQLALRDSHFRSGAERWNRFWMDFWDELSGHCGLADTGTLTARLFDSESFLHMIRWRRAIDRAGLEEMARGWAAWLNGARAPAGPVRDFARAEALREFPALPERDETSARIAEAAAYIVSHKGAASMTHRSVAAEAGLTLGIVSHKFRTSAELMRAAFEQLYMRNVSSTGPTVDPATADQDHWSLNGLVRMMEASVANWGPEELTLVVARDPSFRHFAAQLRYLRGRTSGRHLQAILGQAQPVTPLEAAIFSGFLAGQLRTQLIVPQEDFSSQIHKELERLIALIAPLSP